jgi:hypothetical protein
VSDHLGRELMTSIGEGLHSPTLPQPSDSCDSAVMAGAPASSAFLHIAISHFMEQPVCFKPGIARGAHLRVATPFFKGSSSAII